MALRSRGSSSGGATAWRARRRPARPRGCARSRRAPELFELLSADSLSLSLDAALGPRRVGLFALHCLSAADLRNPGEKLKEAQAAWSRHSQSVLVALRGAGRPCADLCACLLAVQEALGVERELHPAAQLVPGASAIARELTARLAARVDARLQAEGRAPARELPLSERAQADFAAGIALHDAAVAASQDKSPRAHVLVLASLARLEAALGKRDVLLVPSLANAARALSLQGDRAAAEEALGRAIELHAAQPGHDEGEALRLHRLLDHVQTGG